MSGHQVTWNGLASIHARWDNVSPATCRMRLPRICCCCATTSVVMAAATKPVPSPDRTCMQYWRLLTTFLYFGNWGIDFLFHMYFLIRYCRALEEGSFRGQPADFLFCLVLGMTALLVRDGVRIVSTSAWCTHAPANRDPFASAEHCVLRAWHYVLRLIAYVHASVPLGAPKPRTANQASARIGVRIRRQGSHGWCADRSMRPVSTPLFLQFAGPVGLQRPAVALGSARLLIAAGA